MEEEEKIDEQLESPKSSIRETIIKYSYNTIYIILPRMLMFFVLSAFIGQILIQTSLFGAQLVIKSAKHFYPVKIYCKSRHNFIRSNISYLKYTSKVGVIIAPENESDILVYSPEVSLDAKKFISVPNNIVLYQNDLCKINIIDDKTINIKGLQSTHNISITSEDKFTISLLKDVVKLTCMQ